MFHAAASLFAPKSKVGKLAAKVVTKSKAAASKVVKKVTGKAAAKPKPAAKGKAAPAPAKKPAAPAKKDAAKKTTGGEEVVGVAVVAETVTVKEADAPAKSWSWGMINPIKATSDATSAPAPVAPAAPQPVVSATSSDVRGPGM